MERSDQALSQNKSQVFANAPQRVLKITKEIVEKYNAPDRSKILLRSCKTLLPDSSQREQVGKFRDWWQIRLPASIHSPRGLAAVGQLLTIRVIAPSSALPDPQMGSGIFSQRVVYDAKVTRILSRGSGPCSEDLSKLGQSTLYCV